MTAGAAPPDRLDALLDHILERLDSAVSHQTAAWRTPMLATADDQAGPALRTVVIRAIDPALRHLRINTDRRSDKMEHILANPRVQLGFWDPAANQQLRVAGRVVAQVEGPAVDTAWAALRPEGRVVYRSDAPPGTPIAGPTDGPQSTDTATSGGRQALAVLTVTWQRWDWLWLGPDGHRRARFRWSDDGQRQANWVVP